jgi:integrase
MKGHLEKRGNNVWRLKVFIDREPGGKRIFKSKTVHCGKRDAQTALAKFVTEIDETRIGLSDPRLTLAQYLERFQKVRKAKVAHRTWVISESLIRLHINPNIGHLKLRRITDIEIEALYASVELSRKEGIHSILNAAFRYAAKKHLITENPMHLVDFTRGKSKKVTIPPPESVEKAIKAAKPIIRMAITIMVTTGLRRGELLALRWQDIDLDAKVLHVTRNLGLVDRKPTIGPPKTSQSNRSVTLPDSLINAFRDYRQWQRTEYMAEGYRPAEDIVIPTRKGEYYKPQSFSTTISYLGKKIGVNLTPHIFRHYHATHLLKAKVSPVTVKERMGHTHINTTLSIYAHVLKEMEEEAAKVADNLITWETSWETTADKL